MEGTYNLEAPGLIFDMKASSSALTETLASRNSNEFWTMIFSLYLPVISLKLEADEPWLLPFSLGYALPPVTPYRRGTRPRAWGGLAEDSKPCDKRLLARSAGDRESAGGDGMEGIEPAGEVWSNRWRPLGDNSDSLSFPLRPGEGDTAGKGLGINGSGLDLGFCCLANPSISLLIIFSSSFNLNPTCSSSSLFFSDSSAEPSSPSDSDDTDGDVWTSSSCDLSLAVRGGRWSRVAVDSDRGVLW